MLLETAADAEAGVILRETFDRARRVLAPVHPVRRAIMTKLAQWYRGYGQADQADALINTVGTPTLSPAAAFRTSLISLENKLRADDTDPLAALDLAVRQAWLGRMDDWRATSRQIVGRVKDTTFPITAERAAKCALLVPGADRALLEQSAALAHYALEHGKESFVLHFFQLCVGMAEYRRGNDAAAEAVHASIDPKAPFNARDSALLYRAMIALRQGRPEDARRCFAEASALKPAMPLNDSMPLADGATRDDLVTWLAYKEANAMLNPK